MNSEVSFGRWVQRRRRLLDLSAEGLAAQVGISVHMLRKVESDDRRPSREVAELLADALKIAPAEREQFLRLARRQADAAPPGEPVTAPAALVAPGSVLIGRSRERQQLTALLERPDCRLLTLVGPGGIGKTALAMAVAQDQAGSLRDGVTTVTLAGVGAGDMVAFAIAQALGLSLSGFRSPLAQICAELQERALLLVLDNAEHLLARETDATALIELAGALLGAAPQLKILVTSRAPLALQDEWVFEVHGLELPESAGGDGQQEGAAELFVARAQRARPGFAPTPNDAAAIAEICAAVGGAPLGIELAASWLRTLTPREIADQMAHDIGALQSPHRDTPARHRSLRIVFAESWRLLDPTERAALSRLSVFHGGWTGAAAEAVAEATLPTLEGLVAKSLVRRSDAADGASSRYELHALIRQFAGEQLQADADLHRATRDRHAAYYLRALQDSASRLKSQRQLEAVNALKPDMDNLWAAFAWAIASGQFALIGVDWSARFILVQILGAFTQGAAIGARLIAALEQAVQTRDPHELLEARAAAESWQAMIVFRLGRIDAMIQHAQRAVALSDDCTNPTVKFPAHLVAGLACAITGDYARAQWHNEQIVQHAAALDAWFEACAASQLGSSLLLLGRLDEAYAALAAAVAQLRSLGEASMYGVTIWYMLTACLALERLDEARPLALEGLAALERIGDRHYRGLIHNELGLVYLWQGDVAGALAEHQQAQQLLEQVGSARDSRIAALRAGYALARSGQFAAGSAQIRASLDWFWEAQILPNVLEGLAFLADLLQSQADVDRSRMLLWLAIVQAHPATSPEIRTWAQRAFHTGSAQLPPAQVAAIRAAGAATPIEAIMRELG